MGYEYELKEEAAIRNLLMLFGLCALVLPYICEKKLQFEGFWSNRSSPPSSSLSADPSSGGCSVSWSVSSFQSSSSAVFLIN